MSTVTKVDRPTSFAQMQLNPDVMAAVERVGYRSPTPIQAYVIPRAMVGRDIIGQAQTGTGKTAAFLLPFFHNWQPTTDAGPQALILAPTRELAVQISEEAVKLAPSPECKAVTIYGGQKFGKQSQALRGGVALAIGTPGRVLDHLGRGTLSLSQVRYVVLDEADRMLDIGFRPDIERILRRCPRTRQTLFLSATLPPPVMKLIGRYMVKPVLINVSPKTPTVEKIRQTYMTVAPERKFDLLLRVLEVEKPRQCIIFCERKMWAHDIYKQLSEHHIQVAAMHGDLEQSERERIMRKFRDAEVRILVATDVVGRGIDVLNISHIINYDLPDDPENYVHRIGRTGRMGADGIAIAFVTPEQGEQLTRIEQFINKQLDSATIEGFEAFPPKVDVPEVVKPYVPIFGRRTKKRTKRL